MAEYIEREAAIEEFQTEGARFIYTAGGCRAIISRIRVVPAADVAPVVRCGECENWQRGWKPSAAKVGTHFCGITGLCRPADWFCADGERRDGGQDDV